MAEKMGPFDGQKEEMRKMEEGHSSALTNVRVNHILEAVWRAGASALSCNKPDYDRTNEYFSLLVQYYIETHNFVYYPINSEHKKKLEEIFAKCMNIRRKMVMEGRISPTEVERWNMLCLQMQMINHSMPQNLYYFYRYARPKEAGITAAIKLFSTEEMDDSSDELENQEPEMEEDIDDEEPEDTLPPEEGVNLDDTTDTDKDEEEESDSKYKHYTKEGV